MTRKAQFVSVLVHLTPETHKALLHARHANLRGERHTVGELLAEVADSLAEGLGRSGSWEAGVNRSLGVEGDGTWVPDPQMPWRSVVDTDARPATPIDKQAVRDVLVGRTVAALDHASKATPGTLAWLRAQLRVAGRWPESAHIRDLAPICQKVARELLGGEP